MFEQMLENMRKATDASVQMQQETFQRWMNMWPGVPAAQPPWVEQTKQFQKQWADTAAELLKRQQEIFDAQFKAGLKSLEEAFQVPAAKNPEELRAKMTDFWRKTFECMREAYEMQTKEFQNALDRWTALIAKKPA